MSKITKTPKATKKTQAMAKTADTVILERIAEDHAEVTAAYKIDISKGSNDQTVHRQWCSRPDDQRFTSIKSLREFLERRRGFSQEHLVDIKRMDITADGKGGLLFKHDDGEDYPTNYAFQQLCTSIGAPTQYLTRLPAELTAQCIKHSLSKRGETAKLLTTDDPSRDGRELRAITGAEFGRIFDFDLFKVIEHLTHGFDGWKIPGEMDWSTMRHNPFVDTTKDNTTLFASDRDLFMFLCDDVHPIEAGKTASGEPDLYFRGFYAFNSEPGYAQSYGIKTFMLRGVCMNRNLWGVEGVKEVRGKHSKNAFKNFHGQVTPMLMSLQNAGTVDFVQAVDAAKKRKIAVTDEERQEWLVKRSFSPKDASLIMGYVRDEEGHPIETLYDAVQGITAHARRQRHQDKRVMLEAKATELLQKAA